MHYLTAQQILNLHEAVIEETGGSHGVRDQGAVLGLEQLPRQTVFGKDAYHTVFLKAAVYCRNIIFGHPFVDGNKRTAVLVSSVFLERNGYELAVPEGSVEEFALRVISGRLALEEIADWFESNTKRTA